MTQAGSRIDSYKFYYCEKSENLHSCSLLCWLSIMAKAKKPNVNNGLDTGRNKAVNLAG
jgi:hypothetical protein